MDVAMMWYFQKRFFNPSRPDPGQREKINFLFSHFFVLSQKVLWRPLSLKRLHKTFEEPQRNVKIKI